MSGVSQSQSGQQTDQQGTSQRGVDFQALAQALQSGDLTGAQKAFASLQQDMRGAHGHHHHRSSGATQGPQTGVTGASVTNSDSDNDGDNDSGSLVGGINVTV